MNHILRKIHTLPYPILRILFALSLSIHEKLKLKLIGKPNPFHKLNLIKKPHTVEFIVLAFNHSQSFIFIMASILTF